MLTPVEERRQKLIRHLAKLAKDLINQKELPPEGLLLTLTAILGTTEAAVTRDLLALESGEIPGVAAEGVVTQEQSDLAKKIRSARTDKQIDEVMIELASIVADGKMLPPWAKAVQGILMGRRFFLMSLKNAEIMAKAAGKGGKITVVQGPPMGFGGEAGVG